MKFFSFVYLSICLFAYLSIWLFVYLSIPSSAFASCRVQAGCEAGGIPASYTFPPDETFPNSACNNSSVVSGGTYNVCCYDDTAEEQSTYGRYFSAQELANSTDGLRSPICGSAVETLPACASCFNGGQLNCSGYDFSAGDYDQSIKDYFDRGGENGSLPPEVIDSDGDGKFTYNGQVYNAQAVYACRENLFACGTSGCTPNFRYRQPTPPPPPPSCDQIRNDEPHPLRPNPGAPCVDKPDPAGRLSCASDLEMHHVIDDPYGWGAFSCPPGDLGGFTDKSDEKPYGVSVDVTESGLLDDRDRPVIANGQPVKKYACAYEYSRVLQDIEFTPQIDHTLLDLPIAGLASRNCEGPAPGEGCLADTQPAAAILSNYTSWYHQGVVDQQGYEAPPVQNNNRASLLAAEMDEFFNLGVSGYLVWQYSGPKESPLDNDPFSFFKDDPVCTVMKTKAATLGNGQFIGVNMHSLANYDSATIEESLEYLSSECGTSVVRIWGSPDRGGPQAIKKVLDIARNYGVKIIVAIADYSNSSGDILPGPIRSDPTNWYDRGYQTVYLPYVQNMANILKGNPALYAYELANEAHCGGHAECVAPYAEWANQVSAAIKNIDPGVKVGIGQKASEDTTRGDSPTPGDFITSNSSNSINIASGHYYPLNNPSEKILVKAAKSQADSLGKPFYIGEAGIPLDQNSGTGGAPGQPDWITLLGPLRKLIPKQVLDARKNDIIDRALLPAGNPRKTYNQIVGFVKNGKAVPRSQAVNTRDFDQAVRLSDLANHRVPGPNDQPWRDIWENYMPLTSTSDLPGRVFITIGSQETSEFKAPQLIINNPNYKVSFPHNRELDEASNLLQSIFKPVGIPETTNYKEQRIDPGYYDALNLAASYTTVRGKTVTGKAAPRPAFDTQACNLIAKTNSGDRLHDEKSPPKDNTIKGTLFVTKPVVFNGTLYSTNYPAASKPARGESVGTISVYIQNPPAADSVWDRLINGPASVFKAMIPPGLAEDSDIPAQSKGLGYYCGPDCRVNPTSPAAFFPHWGSVLELFHAGIQKMLNPLRL